MKWIHISLSVVTLMAISGCSPPAPTFEDEEFALAATANSDPCVQDILNDVPDEYSRCSPSFSESDATLADTSVASCSTMATYQGEVKTCTIPRAYCEYQLATNGSPTFCNDAPYPNHTFTLLVWGEDWSDFDGNCLVVTGVVSIYRGLPQIEATSRSQVSQCP